MPPPAPPVKQVAYPPHWEAGLRSWLSGIPVGKGPHPFNRVFGQTWDETELLRLCGEGPRKTERGLKADIKLIWDYSRGHSLFGNAASGTGLEESAGYLERWIQGNRNWEGPAWSCPMELSIRAANWVMADVLWKGELRRRAGEEIWAGLLWQHGWLIERGLEARRISSNHYLSNLLGLLMLGSVFPADKDARKWLEFAQDEFSRALVAQTFADGGLNEASLRYHALVTEMALLARLIVPTTFDAERVGRLERMCQILADFSDANGDVIAFGDDDSGRVLALDHFTEVGRVTTLLRLAEVALGKEFTAQNTAFYPVSGWWSSRNQDFRVAVDFGGVGLLGMGSHAHNDDLSFYLEWKDRPAVVDPGTCIYTGDRELRDRFRSTRFHNVLMVDGAEQRPMGNDPFILAGSAAPCAAGLVNGAEAWFEKQLEAGIVHRRTVCLETGGVVIRDRLTGSGEHELAWYFHLHPEVTAAGAGHGVELTIPGNGKLGIANTKGWETNIEEGSYSAGYGRREVSRICVVKARVALPIEVTWNFEPLVSS